MLVFVESIVMLGKARMKTLWRGRFECTYTAFLVRFWHCIQSSGENWMEVTDISLVHVSELTYEKLFSVYSYIIMKK